MESDQPQIVEVKESKRLAKVLFGTVFILCFIGTVVGIPLAVTLTENCNDNEIVETTVPPTTTTTLPALGWQDWTTWTECSVTCGSGQSVRSRECITLEPGTEVDHCEAEIGNETNVQSKILIILDSFETDSEYSRCTLVVRLFFRKLFGQVP